MKYRIVASRGAGARRVQSRHCTLSEAIGEMDMYRARGLRCWVEKRVLGMLWVRLPG